MRTMMTLMMLAVGCGYASAQMTMSPTTPSAGLALGATSPLGLSGQNSSTPSSQIGIPFGATQLNVGGLSPAPGPLVGSGCSTVSSLSSAGMGTFDGGGLSSGMSGGTSGISGTSGMSGLSGTSGSAGSTGCGAASIATGTASGVLSPGSSGTSTLGIGTIPLGATEIDSGGVSPMIVTPAPSTTTTTGMTPGP